MRLGNAVSLLLSIFGTSTCGAANIRRRIATSSRTITLTVFNKMLEPVPGYELENGTVLGNIPARVGYAMTNETLKDGTGVAVSSTATMPGPTLYFDEGEEANIKFVNAMGANSMGATTHWHGILQTGTPYMDGVLGVAQCDVPANGATYKYRFTMDKPGTYWYHSHSGTQYANGMYGALVVRPSIERAQHLNKVLGRDESEGFAGEHIMLISEWEKYSPAQSFQELVDGGKWAEEVWDGGTEPIPMLSDVPLGAILTNGRKGTYMKPYPSNEAYLGQGNDLPSYFRVTKGKDYRFRFINGMANFMIKIHIEGHEMEVFMVDAGEILQPKPYKQILSEIGSRYDFQLNPVSSVTQEPGAYWIYLQGAESNQTSCKGTAFGTNESVETCSEPGASPFQSWHLLSHAVLIVEDPDNDIVFDTDSKVRALLEEKMKDTPNVLPVEEISNDDKETSLSPAFYPEQLQRSTGVPPTFDVGPISPLDEVIETIEMVVGSSEEGYPAPTTASNCSGIPDGCYYWTLNGIKTGIPPVPVYISGGGRYGLGKGSKYVENVEVNKTYDILLKNPTMMGHPMHLHGHVFWVLGSGQNGTNPPSFVSEGKNSYGGQNPALRDTVQIPAKGWSLIRVKFNNPGPWIFHCHIDYHLSSGMAMIFNVGNYTEWPTPNEDEYLPVCGSSPEDYKSIAEDKDWAQKFIQKTVDSTWE